MNASILVLACLFAQTANKGPIKPAAESDTWRAWSITEAVPGNPVEKVKRLVVEGICHTNSEAVRVFLKQSNVAAPVGQPPKVLALTLDYSITDRRIGLWNKLVPGTFVLSPDPGFYKQARITYAGGMERTFPIVDLDKSPMYAEPGLKVKESR